VFHQGQFAVLPVAGKRVFHQDDRPSWFSHKAEQALPHYYRVYLADYDATVEVTPTERAALFRMTYPKTDEAYVVVDAFDKGSAIKVSSRGTSASDAPYSFSRK
jgi:putative alpha-1,2-mannosidase